MIRVLFVDDEPSVLSALRRRLRPLHGQWDMHFAGSAAEGLAVIRQSLCDVVVSDMKMPGMDGAEFLSRVRNAHPETIRIALSGETSRHMIYRCVEYAHQYMAKPCEVDTLIATVQRATKLRDLMADPALQSLVSGLSSVPSVPQNYRKIVEELQRDAPSLPKIAAIVESDVAMTAKILQLVNSAFFGLPRRVSSAAQAAVYLGLDVLKSLVLTTGTFSRFGDVHPSIVDAIWKRSMTVASAARAIAGERTVDAVTADYACMGGMLCEIGKLVLAANLPEKYDRIEAQAAAGNRPQSEIERETVGHSHCEIGAYLMGLWGLPWPVVECVAFYEHPDELGIEEFSPVAAVHLAYAVACAGEVPAGSIPDERFVARLGLEELLARHMNRREAQEVG